MFYLYHSLLCSASRCSKRDPGPAELKESVCGLRAPVAAAGCPRSQLWTWDRCNLTQPATPNLPGRNRPAPRIQQARQAGTRYTRNIGPVSAVHVEHNTPFHGERIILRHRTQLSTPDALK